MRTRSSPPAVVQRANSSPFIAPSLLRTFHVLFMTAALPSRAARNDGAGGAVTDAVIGTEVKGSANHRW